MNIEYDNLLMAIWYSRKIKNKYNSFMIFKILDNKQKYY